MRKLNQQELEKREAVILETAHRLLVKGGLATLNMDRLAAHLPFSKGTIYNHFTSREDVVIALLSQRSRFCHDLFNRASLFRGKPRERFYAVSVAADIDARDDDIRSQFLADEEILAAASAQRRETFFRYHNDIVNLIVGIVRDGIAQGHLPASTSPERLTYSVWSLHLGTDELRSRRFIYRDSDQEGFERERLEMFNAILDGFGWEPFSHQIDYPSLRRRVLDEVFSTESKHFGLWQD